MLGRRSLTAIGDRAFSRSAERPNDHAGPWLTCIVRTMQDFRDLRVWQHARVVARAVYQHTGEFPVEERYGLVAQMRRAAGG